MNLTIFLSFVIGIGAICGALSRDVVIGVMAGAAAFVLGGLGWILVDGAQTNSARYRACTDACLAEDAPMARSDGGCWCYRGARETFRVEVPE